MTLLKVPSDSPLSFLNQIALHRCAPADTVGVSGVYAVVNIQTGMAYIGSAVNVNQRWRGHRWSLSLGRGNRKLQKAWDEYGPEAFCFVLLDTVPIDALLLCEQEWINETQSWTASGYNVRKAADSNLGMKHSAETRAAMSRKRAGVLKSAPHKAKLRVPKSALHAKRIGDAQRGVPKSKAAADIGRAAQQARSHLTWAAVAAIRARYMPRCKVNGCTALAKEFKVVISTISEIVNNKRWVSALETPNA